MKMPIVYLWPTLQALKDVDDNNNNNATNSTAQVIPGGFSGYVHTYDLMIIGAAFILILICVFAIWGWCHRRYKKKKNAEVEQAGNFSVNVSRPNLKK